MPQVDLQQFPLYPPLETITTVREDPGLFRVQHGAPNTYFLQDSALAAYDLSTVSGDDSMAPETVDLLPYRQGAEFTAVADLLNIKYILVPDTITLTNHHLLFVQQAQGVRLYRNDQCLPRLQFVPGWPWTCEPREEELAGMSAPTFDPRKIVFIETDPPESFHSQRTEPGISPTPATVRMEQYTPRRVRAHVRCSQPGVVLLADTFYLGWYATVDGTHVPIYRANYAMRAVFVDAGDHEIEFYYAPLSFRLGAAISGVTIVGCALAGLWPGMRRRATKMTKPVL